MSKFLIFLAIISTQFACHKLSNALDSAILTCGPSIESGLWIKVHPGEGLSLPTDLKAVGLRRSSDEAESLALTEKGCIQVDSAFETVVVSSALTKFGSVYSRDQGNRDITLVNIGDLASARSCSAETFTNEKLIPLPLRLNQPNDEELRKAFRVKVSIQEASQGQSIEILPGIGLDSALDLASLDDGRYIFDFLVRNYFFMVSEKHQCVVTVDHEKPTVEARYRSLKNPAGGRVFLQPAENLFLDVDDGSQVSYCLFHEEDTDSCDEFLPYESFITVPNRGYWSLLYKARDRAGNESEVKHLQILAYDAKSLENISLKAALSSLYSSEGRYTEALAEAIDAERKRLGLGSELERGEALPKVQEALLNAMANTRLKYAPNVHRNRVLQIRMSDSLAESDRLAAVDFDHTVKILSPDGKLIHELKLHTDTIKAAEFVPGTFELITGGYDGKLAFWDSDGRPYAVGLDHRGRIHDVAVQRLHDGKVLLASASADKTVKIWNQSGTAIHTLPHDEAVTSVTIGPDGKIYSGDARGSLYFWDSAFGLTAKLESGAAHSSPVYELVLGQDQSGANALLSAASDESLKVWSDRGDPIRTLEDTEYAGNLNFPNALHFTPNCRFLAIGSGSEVVLVDRTDLSQDSRFPVEDDITAIAINQSCDRVVTADWSGHLSFWTLKGYLVERQQAPDYIYDLRFDKSDRYLWVGRQDNHLGIYAVNSMIPRLKTELSFGSSLLDAHMDDRGEFVVSGSQNGQIDLWSYFNGKVQQRSWQAHEGLVTGVLLDETRRLLLTAGSSTQAKIWDVSTGELKANLEHEWNVSEALFLKNSPYIVTSGGKQPSLPDQEDAGELRLWGRTGELLMSDRSFPNTVYDIVEHPSLNLIAVLAKKIHVYRVEAPGTLVKLAEYEGKYIFDVKWLSLDGAESEPELAISDSNTLTLLRLKGNQLLPLFSRDMEQSIFSVEVSELNSLIAEGDGNGNLYLYDRHGGLKFHGNFGFYSMRAVAFDARGTRLAFAIPSGKVAILDTASGAIQTLNGHGTAVRYLQFTEDGRLMSADENGYIRLWSFKQDQLLREACDFIRQALSSVAPYQDLCKVE